MFDWLSQYFNLIWVTWKIWTDDLVWDEFFTLAVNVVVRIFGNITLDESNLIWQKVRKLIQNIPIR